MTKGRVNKFLAILVRIELAPKKHGVKSFVADYDSGNCVNVLEKISRGRYWRSRATLEDCHCEFSNSKELDIILSARGKI